MALAETIQHVRLWLPFSVGMCDANAHDVFDIHGTQHGRRSASSRSARCTTDRNGHAGDRGRRRRKNRLQKCDGDRLALYAKSLREEPSVEQGTRIERRRAQSKHATLTSNDIKRRRLTAQRNHPHRTSAEATCSSGRLYAFSRMCTAQALPAPTTCVSPMRAPSTWRLPASPRRCVVTS